MSKRWLGMLVAIPVLLLLLAGAWVATQGVPRDDDTCITGRWSRGCGETARTLADGRWTDLRCVLVDRSREVTYPSDELRLTANLHEPRGSAGQPGIVLLHGSSTYGRTLPLNRVLAHRFRAAGYVVIAPDLRGFGASQNPAPPYTATKFDFAADVQASLNYLTERTDADPERLYVVGHSFGGGAALAAAARDERIAKTVLIGPPRRLGERIFADGAPDHDYFVERFGRDMELPEPVPAGVVRDAMGSLDIENHAERMNAERGGSPLLLIDSELEDEEDIAFLREVHGHLGPGVDYWTVPGTDHYLHTGFIMDRPCYNRRVVNGFVGRVDDWLNRQ